jgi:hypothetical protein
MGIKKFLIEVEEGRTDGCDVCPCKAVSGDCRNFLEINCYDYDLTTIKLKEETCDNVNHSIDNSILDNSEFDYGHIIIHTTDEG